MPTSRRRDIVQFVLNELKKINNTPGVLGIILTETGQEIHTESGMTIITEELAGDYEDKRHIYNNVFRGIKFIDQINDFPCIYIQVGKEVFNYDSRGVTTAFLPLMLRVYVYEENGMHGLEDLVEDIANKIERIQFLEDSKIIESVIASVDTDNGLLEPYGLAEIAINILYDVEDLP